MNAQRRFDLEIWTHPHKETGAFCEWEVASLSGTDIPITFIETLPEFERDVDIFRGWDIQAGFHYRMGVLAEMDPDRGWLISEIAYCARV